MRVLAGMWTAMWLVGCGQASTTLRTTYPSGVLEAQYTMRDGERHGIARTWHENRKLASQGTYVGGMREGKFLYFTDEGTFQYQALYIRDEEVWRSIDRNATPDRQAIVEDKFSSPAAATFADVGPSAYFTSLDRTAASDRIGVQLGVGGPGELDFGSSRRIEAFGVYTPGDLGGYAQVSYASLQSEVGTSGSPLSLEGGARYRRSIPEVGTFTARAGLLTNAGARDSQSFIAGTAGSFHRPTDAVAAMEATLVVRTSASIVHTTSLFVVQADLGLDSAFGTDSSAFDPIGRLNIGAGVGAPWAFAAVELVNTMMLTDTGRRLHAIGIGGAFRVGQVLVHGIVSRVYAQDTLLNLAVSHDL